MKFFRHPQKNYETNKTLMKSIDDTWSSILLKMNDYVLKTKEVNHLF